MNPRRLAIFGLVILLAVVIGALARREVMEREARAPEPPAAPAGQAVVPDQPKPPAVTDAGPGEPAKQAEQASPKQEASAGSGQAEPEKEPARAGQEKQAQPATRPSFDVVRVEPGGQAVVAGRAAPGSEVELVARGGVIDRTTANEAGEFVMMPPPLEAGNHELTLRTRDAASKQAVIVSVPERGKGDVLVVVGEAGKPSQVVQAGKSEGTSTAELVPEQPGRVPAPPAAQDDVPLRIGAVEAAGESLFVQGSGPAGANAVIYLNDSPLAEATIGPDGRWSLTVSKGLKAGSYKIRIDQTGEGGKVVARAEVPFTAAGAPAVARAPAAPAETPAAKPSPAPEAAEVPAVPPEPAEAPRTATSASPAEQGKEAKSPQAPRSVESAPKTAASPAAPEAPASAAPSVAAAPERAAPAATAEPERTATADPVVPEIATIEVVRGDNLWQISRRIYGEGIRYSTIYEANSDQIRDPDLIYPGQIFVTPQGG